ncbi:HipA N-terminal domain-containing protein [Glaciecola sp. SC05]|uniref:HipA N-terminal domain-containing protein n=1 Tax=Glaciecola sp. SC05 TaxID=1987355 RepID=UPI003526D125
MLNHKLKVNHRLSNGEIAHVGELAENKNGIYFQYAETYLSKYSNLSPFALEQSTNVQIGPSTPHQKLHGVFADSLPDGWGLYLMGLIPLNLMQTVNSASLNLPPITST